MKKRLLILPVLVAAAAAAYFVFLRRNPVNTRVIQVSGNIEATVAEVSFRVPGRVLERRVTEGDPVKIGQVVARLDAADLEQEILLRRAEVRAALAALAELLSGSRPEEITQARAAMERARARLDELLAGSRPQEVAAAEAQTESARAEAERWSAEHDRQRALFERDVISAREYEVALSAHRTAQASLRDAQERLHLLREGTRKEVIAQARAALAEAEQRYAQVRNGPRRETIEQARARVDQTRGATALAETRLGYATAMSPFSGLVLSKNVEPGEYVAPGTPVVTVGDLGNVWFRAYVAETDLGRVKLGQKVTVTADTYPGKTYEGRVSFLSSQAEFTPKAVQTQKERVKLVYRVKVDVPNPNMELKPGMPADGVIRVGDR